MLRLPPSKRYEHIQTAPGQRTVSIKPEDVHHIARLARLKISEAEVVPFAEQLGNILDLADQMQQVDTDKVQPLAHPQDPTLRLREDVVTDNNRRDDFMALSEHSESGLYRVPKVID